MLAGITVGVSSCAATCCAACACETCKCISSSISRRAARFVYCTLFLLSMVTAWILRDYGKGLIEKIPWIKYNIVSIPSDEWYGVQAVTRISLGCFMYFILLGFLTLGVKKLNDPRDKIQNKFWIPKIMIWLIFNVLPFFFRENIMNPYTDIARIGSGFFLLIQMLILLDFLYILNTKLIDIEGCKGQIILILITSISYIASIIISVFLYKWFVSDGCSLNNFFITFTIVISSIFSLLSIHPRIEHGSLLPSSIITLYNVYLCYSSLASEPSNYICNNYSNLFSSTGTNITLYSGVFTTIFSVVYSAFRAGSTDTETFSLNNAGSPTHASRAIITNTQIDIENGPTEDEEIVSEFTTDVSYNYSFFHLIFALASMYMAMLYTGWGEETNSNIGIGWTNVWVKMISSWMISLLYMWTLIAPLIFPDRVFR